MAFLKYANASVITPHVSMPAWDEVRAHSMALRPAFGQKAASKVVLEKYDPGQYLLSHCTIIASVDTDSPGLPLGHQMVEGVQIDRRYPDFYIAPRCSKFVNNNHDAWERKLLMACFRTFIGGENYVEHLQIPELSKGKIIDAAARDVGDSVYVDILVATDRKHKPLIAAVESRQLQTLSMGCFVPGTPVTMADGRRIPIEEVVPGDMVLTHKGRVREVLNKQIRGGRWGMRRIHVVGVPAPIEATNNHPFFVIRPAKVCACGCGEPLIAKDADPVRRMSKRFQRGHDKRILNPNGTYSLSELRSRKDALADIQSLKVEEVRADELEVGDYVIFPKLETERSSGDPGADKARLLGYFLAEGSFLKSDGVPVEVQFNFSLKEKGTLVEEVVRLLRECFPGCSPWVQDREDRTLCVVHVYGKDIAAWFKTHGGEYSHLKRLSLDAMTWSVDSHRELLGAWLNGDGHHRKATGNSIGTTTSFDLACQLHVLSVQCGIPLRLECVFGGKSVSISEAVVGGVSSRHEVTGKLAAFNLCFPKASSKELSKVSVKAPQSGQAGSHLRALDDKVIFPITQIEEFQYEGFVHDMEVEEDHSYLVHGLAVHNCQVGFTICTKCGNRAEDETQLCKHIRYQKGNHFIDGLGQSRKIAELCGHINEEPGSVKFIEASWVANPAFTGAVLRDILTPAEQNAYQHRVQMAFAMPPRTVDPNAYAKAARVEFRQYDKKLNALAKDMATVIPKKFSTSATGQPVDVSAFGENQGGQEQFPGAGEGDLAEKKDTALGKAIDDLAESLREKAIQKVRREMTGPEAPRADLSENRNDTLVRQAVSKNAAWRSVARFVMAQTKDPKLAMKCLKGLIMHKQGGWQAVKAAGEFSSRECLAISRMLDVFYQTPRMAGETRIYRTVCAVGGVAAYENENGYLAACRRHLGRQLTGSEEDALLTKGRIYDLGS